MWATWERSAGDRSRCGPEFRADSTRVRGPRADSSGAGRLAACSENYSDAIPVGARCGTVNACTANGNGTNAGGTTRHGIACGTGCTVSACTASDNADDGITMSTFGSISGCSIWENGDDGIFASGGGTIIRECSCTGNVGDGWAWASGDCLLVGNICDNHSGAAVGTTDPRANLSF